MSTKTVSIPPVAFYGETLVFYLALDVSPEVELRSAVTIGGVRYPSRGVTVPSALPRPRMLYEFSTPLPRLNISGDTSTIHIFSSMTHCDDLSEFKMVYVTNRGEEEIFTVTAQACE